MYCYIWTVIDLDLSYQTYVHIWIHIQSFEVFKSQKYKIYITTSLSSFSVEFRKTFHKFFWHIHVLGMLQTGDS